MVTMYYYLTSNIWGEKLNITITRLFEKKKNIAIKDIRQSKRP